MNKKTTAILILTIIILLFINTAFGQKTYKVNKVIYAQKYDSVNYSLVSIVDVDMNLSYNKDTLFVDFPQETYYIAYKFDVEQIGDVTISETKTYSTEGYADVICYWKQNKLKEVKITEYENITKYLIKNE